MHHRNILAKQKLSHEDYVNIKRLEDICMEHCKLHLKLELDFKYNLAGMHKTSTVNHVNDFLCYSGRELIGYLSIFNLGGKTCEISGMVHPRHRRKGIFSELYSKAIKECERRGISDILLVCDSRSDSGLAFIRKTGAALSFSEYLMSRPAGINAGCKSSVTLRRAVNRDAAAIAELNHQCFGFVGFTGILPEEEDKFGRITYLIEHNRQTIGKIRFEISDNQSFIEGFCILPGFRGRGLGKQALMTAISYLPDSIERISLLTEADNHAAIKVYQNCGFSRVTTLGYYKV